MSRLLRTCSAPNVGCSLRQYHGQHVGTDVRLHQQTPRQVGVHRQAKQALLVFPQSLGQQRPPKPARLTALLEIDNLPA